MMKGAVRRGLLGVLILVLAAPPGAFGQFQPPPPAGIPAPPTFRQEELDQLLAPIALYPDALLAQILMASTYPLEVVQAARWVKAYPNVIGPQLEEAMQQQPWDPSVKSLTAFPQVLAMMDANLDWTQRLGDAFLAQQPAVMATIQTLRVRAQAAGYLQSTPQQIVVTEPQAIRIEPVIPEIIYVPIYDPTVVYGLWWAPAYPPYYWYPPGYVVGASVLSFGVGLAVGSVLWGGFDWHRHHVTVVNVHNFNTFNRTTIITPTWHHDASHRRGVPYHDPGVRQRFGQGPLPGAGAREAFRGRAPQVPQSSGPLRSPVAPSIPQTPRPPAVFEGLGRGGEIRNFSNRGRMSRMGASAARQAPSVPKAPAGGGRGGADKGPRGRH
ncbi:MAG: DUF3300 domain-containing protein [candidate division NC10 bacterium]|nr:DUF3300 domain-containing protein [candidate division NC10 bacterium]MDE2321165.1 DUF3300 domain-containing protein [candidate division NC10 bacterium]